MPELALVMCIGPWTRSYFLIRFLLRKDGNSLYYIKLDNLWSCVQGFLSLDIVHDPVNEGLHSLLSCRISAIA